MLYPRGSPLHSTPLEHNAIIHPYSMKVKLQYCYHLLQPCYPLRCFLTLSFNSIRRHRGGGYGIFTCCANIRPQSHFSSHPSLNNPKTPVLMMFVSTSTYEKEDLLSTPCFSKIRKINSTPFKYTTETGFISLEKYFYNQLIKRNKIDIILLKYNTTTHTRLYS